LPTATYKFLATLRLLVTYEEQGKHAEYRLQHKMLCDMMKKSCYIHKAMQRKEKEEERFPLCWN